MSTALPDLDAFADLVCAHLDGSITPEDHASLDHALATSAEHRAVYRELAAIDSLIAWDHRWPRTEVKGQKTQIDNPLSPRERAGVRANFKLSPALASLAAAVLLAAASVAIYVFVFSGHRTSPIEDRTSRSPLATLIESTTAGALSTPGDLAIEGSEYGPGAYALSSGTAEFMLTNSVNVKLLGETRMWMQDEMNVSLSLGSAEFVVPSGAEGFTVNLPGGAKVVDLGTRFKVRINEAGEAVVTVSEGAVRVEPGPDAADGAPPRELGRSGFVRLASDGSVLEHIESGGALTHVGTDTDTAAAWRTPSTVKPLDVDGDHVYGTDGYVIYATELAQLPDYIESVARPPMTWDGGPDANKGVIDDPNDPSTPISATHGHSWGSDSTLTLRVRRSDPKPFRLTLLVDSFDDTRERSEQDITVSVGSQEVAIRHDVPFGADADRMTYQVFDIPAGLDDVVLKITKAPNDNPGLTGFAFDSPGPHAAGAPGRPNPRTQADVDDRPE